MAQRFGVIQDGRSVVPELEDGRTLREAVAVRIARQRPASTTPRSAIPPQAFIGIRPNDRAPDAASGGAASPCPGCGRSRTP